MSGKLLKNLFCCRHSKAEDMKDDELRPTSARHDQIEQNNSDQTNDLLEIDQRITLMNKKYTYKRNESPYPMEVANLKMNGTTVSFLTHLV